MTERKSTFQITSSTTAEGWLKKESHDITKRKQDRYFVLDAAARKIQYYEEFPKNIKGEYSFTPASTVDATNQRGKFWFI